MAGLTRGATFREACPARDNPGSVTSPREEGTLASAPSTRSRHSAAVADSAPPQRGCRIPRRPFKIAGGFPPAPTKNVPGPTCMQPGRNGHATRCKMPAPVARNVPRHKPARVGPGAVERNPVGPAGVSGHITVPFTGSVVSCPARVRKCGTGPDIRGAQVRGGVFCLDTSVAPAPVVPRGPAPRNARAGIAVAIKAPS